MLDAKFNSSSELPSKGEYKNDPRARVLGDYKLLSNNCTTCVSDALNQSGSNALAEAPASRTYGVGSTKERFVIPASLQSFLGWQASSWLGNHSVEKARVVEPKKEDKR